MLNAVSRLLVPLPTKQLIAPCLHGSRNQTAEPAARRKLLKHTQKQRAIALEAAADSSAEHEPIQTTTSITNPAVTSVQLSSQFSSEQRQQLWDSVSRSLLKLGRAGVQDTQLRSLQDLLSHHTLVKVQLNGNPRNMASIAATISSATGAHVVMAKINVLLFAKGDMSVEELLQHAQAEADKIKNYHQKRMVRSQQGPPPVEPKPAGRSQASKPRGPPRSSGVSIGQLIDGVTSRSGPLTRTAIKKEWSKLVEAIVDVENQEAQGKKPVLKKSKSKAPWKQDTTSR